MRAKLIADGGGRVHALVCANGDEAMAELRAYCAREEIASAGFSAIGAASGASLAFFDWDTRGYLPPHEVDEQVEVLSFSGTVAWHEGEPLVHAHTVLGRRDGSALGGHVLTLHARPTLEIVLIEGSARLEKRVDPDSTLPTLDI
jgi:uncharacterized protein